MKGWDGPWVCRQDHFTNPWCYLFSGQIWKTEDMKMSVPGLVAPQESLAQPASLRGNCPARGTCKVPLPCSGLHLSPPQPEDCGSTQAFRAQGSHCQELRRQTGTQFILRCWWKVKLHGEALLSSYLILQGPVSSGVLLGCVNSGGDSC